MSLIFDTHAHYDDPAFDADRDALLAAMPESGVGLILDPGCDLASSRAAVALAERFPHVYAAVGWHPENCAPFVPEDIDALRELAKHPKVVAIGEIGLDYHWAENPPREFQQDVLRRQLALAAELDLPVYVGFDGPLTYKNARKAVAVASEAPLDRILIETDAPYLAPAPLRGTRNDSRALVHVAAKLAALRGMTAEEIVARTAENGRRLFGVAQRL